MAMSVVSKCVDCPKLRKKPLQQLMGQLPSLRVAKRRISSILEHSYGHAWATAVQTEPKNTQRRPGSNFHMRNNASASPGTRNFNNNNNNIHLYSAFLLVIQSALQSVNT